MTAAVIDGKAIAESLRARVAAAVAGLAGEGVVPGLAVVLVGENPASQVYVRSKGKQTVEAGMRSFDHTLPADTPDEELLSLDDTLAGELRQRLARAGYATGDVARDLYDWMGRENFEERWRDDRLDPVVLQHLRATTS